MLRAASIIAEPAAFGVQALRAIFGSGFVLAFHSAQPKFVPLTCELLLQGLPAHQQLAMSSRRLRRLVVGTLARQFRAAHLDFSILDLQAHACDKSHSTLRIRS
jgi:hypothetical protein